MKWIGQHIYDLISRFRNDVYLEDIDTGTIASGGNLGLDSNNKIVKAAETTGDITSVKFTTDSGSGAAIEVTTGTAAFALVGTNGVGVTNSGPTITATAVPGEIDHDSLLNFAADEHYTQANITTVGTIGTGEWRGTAINKTYINPDQRGITGVGVLAAGTWNATPISTAYIADDAVTFAKASGVSPNVFGNVIKVLPSDFVTNDDGGVTKFGIGYVDSAGTTYGMKPTNADTELYAFVSIPEGMTATHVDIHAKQNRDIEVFEVQINADTMVSKGTGTSNTTLDITDVAATSTNLLALKITTTSTGDRLFGAAVTIA